MRRPSPLHKSLVDRAKLYALLREFFSQRDVLEVDTPLLCAHGPSDPYIDSFACDAGYLQSSPEFAMKRLLASGSGPIYQICHAFRRGEAGLKHNPEFTMLEWYRPGFSLQELMTEVEALLVFLAQAFSVELDTTKRFANDSYRDLFEHRFAANPHQVTSEQLETLAEVNFPAMSSHISKGRDLTDQYRDLLFSQGVEPDLKAPHFVTDFPASQAALSKTHTVDGDEVACRFELYWQGVELANGYDELLDGEVLLQRIETDNQIRTEKNLPEMLPDKRLLAAMSEMPESAGVAVGVDRLLMLLTGRQALSEVLAFPHDIA